MPIWVRGNLSSKTFIIFNHGGPGDTSMFMHKFSTFADLEKDYALVYWDQRLSGISQGNPDKSSINVDDFVEDLDLVVDTLKLKYDVDSLFLYGISWGGTLGSAYMSDSAKEAKINGFIEESGGHNMIYMLVLSIDIIKSYAVNQIGLGINENFWQQALNFYDNHPDSTKWTADQYSTHSEYLDNTKPFDYTTNRLENEFSGPDAQLIFYSPLSLAMFSNQSHLLPQFNILSVNLDNAMSSITSPVLLLWGEYDIISPPPMADRAESYLTTSIDVRKRIFSNAGHNPSIDQPQLFKTEIRSFIEDWK